MTDERVHLRPVARRKDHTVQGVALEVEERLGKLRAREGDALADFYRRGLVIESDDE